VEASPPAVEASPIAATSVETPAAHSSPPASHSRRRRHQQSGVEFLHQRRIFHRRKIDGGRHRTGPTPTTLVFSVPNHAYDLKHIQQCLDAKNARFHVCRAIIGVPIVLTYTITIYYIFRGKVVLAEESY
jgi:hypothetical protein